MKDKNIVVSGMRPTGRLHLGNYHGALKNWVSLQDKYKCFFFVADYHALTTADKTENIAANSREMVIDWLTAGLDPEKAVIFVQSHIPQVSELNLLLGMVTPLGMLLRNPSYKEQLNEIFRKKYAGQMPAGTQAGMMAELTEQELSELSSFGFLGYPVLMATDILLYGGTLVPVGQDQTAHIEIAAETARKFNNAYEHVFESPRALYTEIPKVPGIDGRKMSKSYNNAIELGEDVESARKKVMSMFTDPEKKKANDPGHPDNCVVFSFHKIYNPDFKKRCEECKAGALGCVQCKKDLFAFMEPEIKKFNEKRKVFEKETALVEKILTDGAKRAESAAKETLHAAKTAMRLL